MELLVTMALLGLGFVAMIGLFSVIVITGRSPTNDAQLAALARQVEDYIESPNQAYIVCGTAAQYDSALASAISAGTITIPSNTTIPSKPSVHVVEVQQASGGTHTIGGVGGQSLTGIGRCGAGQDFGVQQIEIQLIVPNSDQSLSRIVYKRWN